MNINKKTFSIWLLALLASNLMGLGIGIFFLKAPASHPQEIISSAYASGEKTAPIPESSLLRKSSESFRAVAKQVGPAVVVIKSTVAPKSTGPVIRRFQRGGDEGQEGLPNDPFFDFFRQFGQPFRFPTPNEAPQTGLGSGIIISKDGYIVTNNHVVAGATKVVVNLPSDENNDIPAKVIGTDPRSDLAVLKISKGNDLPTAEWADSDAVEVGDWAVAIGSPFMLTHTVTVGVISAKGRNSSNIMGTGYGYELIQTDAAINPGNSGGPLCTIDGKVMGVNSAIYTRSGGYMGIGFAIPSNLAKDIVAKLSRGEKIVRGWLGLMIQPVDPSMADELKIKGGALIHEVQTDSPASNAGLKPGDVITEIDGKQIKDVTDVQRLVSSARPGDRVRIKLLNYDEKKTRTVDVKVGEQPTEQKEEEVVGQADGEPDKLGLLVAPQSNGIKIMQVQPGSPAQMAGLERGDVILSINRRRIHSLSEYRSQLKGAKQLNILARHNGHEVFFRVTLPE